MTFQTHGQFPNPLQNVGLSDFLTLLKALEKFFTQADYLLDPSALPHLLPTFTFAPNNIQLPPYMGGRTLVDPKDPKYNPTLDVTTSLAHLLNFLKTLNINEIIQSIPLGKRVGHQHVSFACMELDADWLITTLHEFMMLTPAQQAVAQLRASEIDTLIHVLPAVQSQALVTSLTTQIAAREQQLQAQNAAAQQQIATLQAQIPAMQTQIAATQAQIQQVTNQIQALQQSPSPAVGPVLGGLLAQRVALQARLTAQQTAFNQLQAILAVAQHTIVNIDTGGEVINDAHSELECVISRA